VDITGGGGNITVVLPHGDTPYDITTNPGGGNLSDPVPSNSSARDKITVDSGGGDISITEAS
jgi:hypothetical protein